MKHYLKIRLHLGLITSALFAEQVIVFVLYAEAEGWRAIKLPMALALRACPRRQQPSSYG